MTALATMGVAIFLLADFDYDRAGELQFYANTSWIKVIHSRYIVGIDGISLPLLVLSTVITVLVMIYSWNHIPEPGNPKAFLMLMLVARGRHERHLHRPGPDPVLRVLRTRAAADVLHDRCVGWREPQVRRRSSSSCSRCSVPRSCWSPSWRCTSRPAATASPNGVRHRAAHRRAVPASSQGTQLLIFGGMFIGFAIKVPMFPFHTWLPDAHTQAPTQGSVILAAILLKLGTYGFIAHRHPDPSRRRAEVRAPWIGLLAVIGIIYGALGCLAQTDMKRLIAFSSVAHMGLRHAGHLDAHQLRHQRRGVRHGRPRPHHRHVVLPRRLGEGALPHARDRQAGRAAPAGAAPGLDPRLVRDGLARPARSGRVLGRVPRDPVGLQPAAGLSSDASFRAFMVVAAVGTVLAAAYLLWLYQRTAFGEPAEEWRITTSTMCMLPEWLAWAAVAHRHRGARRLPSLMFDMTDDAVGEVVTAASRRSAAERARSLGRQRTWGGQSPTSTTTPSRPRSCSLARCVWCCSPSSSSTRPPEVADVHAGRRRPAGARSSRC